MFKKLLLAVLAIAFLASPLPVLAQTDFDLGTDLKYDTTYDYTTDFDWDSLSAEDQAAATALATVFGGAWIVMMVFSMLIGLASYVFMSWALMVVGNKIGIKDSWFVWVPLLNLVFFVRVAQINPWLLLLLIVPGINAIFMIYFVAVAYMNMAEKRGLEKMLGLLVFVPVVNYIFTGYLAWGNITPKVATQPVTPAVPA